MELHLIRHGQTNWNEEKRIQGQSDSVLTPSGYSAGPKPRAALGRHSLRRALQQ
jgi:broad specificity phosphatase PhoE